MTLAFCCGPYELCKVVNILGIGFLPHLNDRVPVVFTGDPEDLSVVVNIKEDHRVRGSIIDGDDALLVAILESQLRRFGSQVVKQIV